jgi:hypothetical protein
MYHLNLLHVEVDLCKLEPSLKAFWAQIHANFTELEGVFKVLALDESLGLLKQERNKERILLNFFCE